MKTAFALMFAFLFAFSAPQRAEASDIATSVVAGVVVTQYVGVGAGVAVSMVLAGAAVVIHSSGKEAVAQAALNDVQDFYQNGRLSVALENTINSLQDLDPSLSDEEAVDLVVEAVM
jgi:hypothetical protein